MTSSPNTARRLTATLTFRHVQRILLDMGLEQEDAVSFWRQARREAREQGYLERRHRQDMARLMAQLNATD